jgi:hypothetical protein
MVLLACFLFILIFFVLLSLREDKQEKFINNFGIDNIKDINSDYLLSGNKIYIYDIEYIKHLDGTNDIQLFFKYKENIKDEIGFDTIVVSSEFNISNEKIAKRIYNAYIFNVDNSDKECVKKDKKEEYFNEMRNKYGF